MLNKAISPSTKELRELVSKQDSEKFNSVTLSNNFQALTENILHHPTQKVYKETQRQLNKLYESVQGVFDYANVPEQLQKQRFIGKTGAAISPLHALHTVKDVFRVSAFIRATHAAITDLTKKFDEKIHIVYPACGPLAPLLLPLLMHYKQTGEFQADDFHITFIDIQEGAVIALKEILMVAGLEHFVKDVLFMDAVDYQTRPHEDIHLVLLEAMQHGFTREGQLAISHHFASLLHKDGLFLPEKVSVSAFLADPEIEFIQRGKHAEEGQLLLSDKSYCGERYELGDILTITLASLRDMQFIAVDQYTRLLECETVKIPDVNPERKQHLMLFRAEMEIYAGEKISEYESGISHPLPDRSICINFTPRDLQDDDLVIHSGDSVQFYYRLNGEPGFFVVKADSTDNCEETEAATCKE